ncbi:hypothetical protein PRIPAC_97676 [Pristionchus pacificus]|uniref:Uncharacterized protein n=1 Tax=Pristionchus pacificus TaxID=54126 RepID=A0A2A6BC94_PRIPA|nr:hypothetical protein PRIPAC_97676 [Pristionchus pacificus]|eukprot:PDM63500.1 hypothetical protein PRIPAC_53857 [Pristionchus pacificus]
MSRLSTINTTMDDFMEAKLVETREGSNGLMEDTRKEDTNVEIERSIGSTTKFSIKFHYPHSVINYTKYFYPPTSSIQTAFFFPQYALNTTYRNNGVEGSLDALTHLLSIKQREDVNLEEKHPKVV